MSPSPQVLVWSEGANGEWTSVLVVDLRGVPAWRVSWSLSGSILAVSDGSNAVTLWKETIDGCWQQIAQQ